MIMMKKRKKGKAKILSSNIAWMMENREIDSRR